MYVSMLRRRGPDMARDDQRGCFVVVFLIALLGVTTYLSWREARYLLFGERVNATLLRTYEVHGRGAGTVVDFEFTDPKTGQKRRHSDRLRLGWQAPPGPLPVEFVPGGASYARVAGHHRHWTLWIFGAAVLAAIGYIAFLIREANSPLWRSREPSDEQP